MTQCEKIVNYMMTGREINDKIARDSFGITRLSARIWDIAHQGYPIDREYRTVKNRFGEDCSVKFYWIPKEVLDDWDKHRAN